MKGPVRASNIADFLSVLADVPCATVPRIAEDTGHNTAGMYRCVQLLLEKQLIEEAGPANGYRRKAMTYRLHPRLRREP